MAARRPASPARPARSVHLQYALNDLRHDVHVLAGELTAAAALVEEVQLIAEVTGNPAAPAYAAAMLAAWRGREQAARS